MSLADPELHNYPIAYMSEPGFWSMDEDEVKGLRAYLAKGGFMIFDDFRGARLGQPAGPDAAGVPDRAVDASSIRRSRSCIRSSRSTIRTR